MTELTPRETSLVALGAALASNCIPCIEHHVPLARKNGLSEAEIFAAIELADRIRQVPARKVLEAARATATSGAAANVASPMAAMANACADMTPAAGKSCC